MWHWKNYRTTRWILCLLLWSAAFSGCARSSYHENLEKEEAAFEKTTEALDTVDEVTTDEIYVHVCGFVKKPGLYILEADSRVGDAISAAGGFAKKADEAAVNLASILSDGMQINVPAKNSQSKTQEETHEKNSSSESGLVNINTASVDELISLSGIGESRAGDIVSYREEKGSFSSIEDIKNVSGIGEGIFNKIKDSITV